MSAPRVWIVRSWVVGVKYLDNAAEIADWVKGHLEDPRSGGLFDTVVRPDAMGNLKVPTKDARDNMEMADAFLRLYLATGEDEYAKVAQRILQAFMCQSCRNWDFSGRPTPWRRSGRFCPRSLSMSSVR